MEDTTTTTNSGNSGTDNSAEPSPERFPISTKDMVRQIYLLCGVVIALLSLAIWLMMSLS